MTPDPKSVSENTAILELADAMQKHEIHAAPVIDAAGRPKGVVTRTDVIEYWNNRLMNGAASTSQVSVSQNCHQLPRDEHTVQDIMTPAVFHVHESAPIAAVADRMLALEIRCLFVTDKQGVLIGLVNIFDALRHAARNNTRHASYLLEKDSCLLESAWELPTELRI
jgi:CBS-domain-containing membrane protein